MAKPIVPILIGVGLIAAFAMMSKKAGAAEKPKDEKPKEPLPDYLPGTKTLKSSVRIITHDLPTPSHFALRYAGDDKRWRELLAVNPRGVIYPDSPALYLAYPVLDSDGVPTGAWSGTDSGVPASMQSLLPWAWDQKVVLPDSWLALGLP